ncbi:inorganic diphosphatase [Streptomyces sp. NPDC056112]|uniref:inorganic diphosphatase n=1 Tax=unclassified Streptomyces TaxID=2593676 RepID=UPI002480891B|nr:inorganic diphosphatase [Streptomyces sp. HYC2]
MMEVTVQVEATVGSRVAPDHEPEPTAWQSAHPVLDGFPVGEGFVGDSLTPDGEPADVLVLMEEPALPGTVRARPVALLHASVDGQPVDEVVCVTARDPRFEEITDLPGLQAWHCDDAALEALLRRLGHGRAWQVVRCEGAAGAEEFLSDAHHTYERLTGCID